MRKLREFTLHSIVIAVIALGLLLVISWFITTPDRLGPFGITVWFVLLWAFLTGVFGLLRLGIGKLLSFDEKHPRMVSGRQGALLAAWATSLLALQSLGQLGVKDIVLVTVLVLLIEFYMRRAVAV